MSINLKRMTLEDVAAVYEIERNLFPDPWPEQSFTRDVLDTKIAHPFVAFDNNEIVGYFVCWYYSGEVHIGNVAVKKSRQQEGIGKLLMKEIFRIFPKYQFAYLEVRYDNLPAIRLYDHFGFKEMYRRRAYYPNGDDAVVMVKIREEIMRG